VGTVVALPALRLSGIYLALATAAFAIIMDNWILALPPFTLFGRDISIWDGGSLQFVRFGVGDWNVDGTTAYFLFGAVAFAAMVVAVTAIRRSTFGLRLVALRDSEAAYATLGMNRQAAVLAVFAISAAMAGVGGGIFGAAVQSTAANRFDFFSGLTLLLVMVVFGLRHPLSAVVAGFYLGSPLFANLFPGSAPVPILIIGVLGVTLGRDPDGVIPRASRRIRALLDSSGRSTAPVEPAPADDPFSAPLEALGLYRPFTERDVAALDRGLGLASTGGSRAPR
jgi:branched-chain amino acid transport system permease protein